VEHSRRIELSAHVRAFLYSCIDSVEQMDVLLLLRASGTGWSARGVADELGLPDARARAWLDALAARGLAHATVRDEVTYTFRPASETLGQYCDELAAVIESSRAAVVRFVAELPPPALRSFANAFKLRDTE